METKDIDTGELTFTVDLCGSNDAPAVIFLHGFPASRHTWQEVMLSLATHGYRAIAPDQRGYSPGARPEGIDAYHVDLIVDDVIAIAESLNVGRFHLVGHDIGGQVAWIVANRYADRVLSLTVLSRPHPAAFHDAIENDPVQAELSKSHKLYQDPQMAASLLANDCEAIRNELCFEYSDDTPLDNGLPDKWPKRRMSDAKAADHLSVLGNPEAMEAAVNWYRAGFNGRTTLARKDEPQTKVPTLYIWGNEDTSVGEIAATNTSRYVTADFRFVVVEGGGHYLAEETPDNVLEYLIPHIASHRTA